MRNRGRAALLIFLGIVAYAGLRLVQHSSIFCNSIMFKVAIQQNDFESIDKFLNSGCDANVTEYGLPMIMIGAMSGSSIYILDYLRMRGAKPPQQEYPHQAKSLQSSYLEAFKSKERDPIESAFEKIGVLFEKSDCQSVGEPYDFENLFVSRFPIDQRPLFKNKMVIEAVSAAGVDQPAKKCPQGFKKFYVDTETSTFTRDADTYRITGLKVYCCKDNDSSFSEQNGQDSSVEAFRHDRKRDACIKKEKKKFDATSVASLQKGLENSVFEARTTQWRRPFWFYPDGTYSVKHRDETAASGHWKVTGVGIVTLVSDDKQEWTLTLGADGIFSGTAEFVNWENKRQRLHPRLSIRCPEPGMF